MELTELEAAGLKAALYGPPADRVWLYVHGKGGCKEEAEDFAALACPRGWQVLAADLPGHGTRRGDGVPLDPWHAAPELRALLGYAKGRWQHTALRCTSLGAWFSLLAFAGERLEQALFVSPVVDMEGLIRDMMGWAGVSEAQLEAAGELDTPFGETLSWPYLQYVRAHPVSRWPTPTALLYASGDAMLRRTAVEDFARRFGGALTVLEGGEHWFHTPEQLAALHRWESDVLEQMK
ncbi:alpha/beta hydrolase [Flavonifractor plautii]|uniref:alpha/beta hydrolase n=1 Tax=Flavonifractor plautii TaxID=292800 RepID=UPI00325A4E81